MAMSLGFHIVFAAIGIAMPLLMLRAELRWRKTGDAEYLRLTKQWAKGTAVLFAVGAVSGTVLSFELGLLFPTFMKHAGAIIGMPFSLEGVAFFTEAIFLGVYLYGWERVSPRLHILAGAIVCVSGSASAVFVTIANAWMNAPTGFRFVGGQYLDIDPIAAMGNRFALHEVLHMLVAAFMATGFGAAAVHAWALRRAPASTFHKKALELALGLAIPFTLAQPLIGHIAGQEVARLQPLKLAAIEQHVHTSAHAPLHLGPIAIPSGLSVLAFNRPAATVIGLDQFPPNDWPSPVVRVAFQAMVLSGGFLALVAAWALVLRLRRRGWAERRWLLLAVVASGPLAFLAIEAGWVVTEVGRQPWVIYHVLRTADAATQMPGLVVPFLTFTLVYLGLAATVLLVIWRQVKAT
jgi:cytochrome d ubiquinol oxidase subunit I